MKKIFMVCSCLALLLALSVPTFAVTFSGTFVPVYYDTTEERNVSTADLVPGVVYRVSTGSTSHPYICGTLNGATINFNTHGAYIFEPILLNPSDEIVWDRDTEHYALARDYAYIKIVACDGSSCPATDVNYDGVCDDCGYALTMSIRPYPSVDGLWDKAAYPYGVLYMRNDNIPSLYFLDNPITTSDGVDFRFNGGNFVVYNLVDGAWTYERTGQGAVEFPDLDSGRILKVSHDVNFQGVILMYKDSDFFPTPLWETVGLATQGAMTEEMPKMGGTMTILVACGVGLMACLVVLSLFGKRSLIFRS